MENLYEKRNSGLEKAINVISVLLICLLALTIFLNTFVLMRVRVSGPSMENTLQSGDCLVINKLKKADYGDIIIAQSGNKMVIKRIVAFGGDSIKIERGEVYLKKTGEQDYKKLNEPYLKDGVTTIDQQGSEEWVLEENQVFYMGDNRLDSTDCRTYGPVDAGKVLGVVTKWSLKYKKFLTKLNNVSFKSNERSK